MADRSVLIIDDDQTLVGALKEGLESLGYTVNAAFDGLQGILQAHQDKPDAIMLDFNMPAGGGAGVYERLRTSADTGKIPIIFLTGATVEEVQGKIRTTPNTYFLRKPVSVAQMRKILDKIIDASPGKQPSLSPAPAREAAPPPAPVPQAPPPAPVPDVPGASIDPFSVGRNPVKGPETLEKEKFAGLTLPQEKKESPPAAGKIHKLEFRVPYADTDRLGIVHYGNYFKYFEQGRTELLRSMGLLTHELEMHRKVFLPVVESRCEYASPSRYDDVLSLASWVSWLGPASVCFTHELASSAAPDRIVARGFTRHATVNELWKPSRLPPDIREKFAGRLNKA